MGANYRTLSCCRLLDAVFSNLSHSLAISHGSCEIVRLNKPTTYIFVSRWRSESFSASRHRKRWVRYSVFQQVLSFNVLVSTSCRWKCLKHKRNFKVFFITVRDIFILTVSYSFFFLFVKIFVLFGQDFSTSFR